MKLLHLFRTYQLPQADPTRSLTLVELGYRASLLELHHIGLDFSSVCTPSSRQFPFQKCLYLQRDIAPYRDNLGSSVAGTYRGY
jgi:hypothetical protein